MTAPSPRAERPALPADWPEGFHQPLRTASGWQCTAEIGDLYMVMFVWDSGHLATDDEQWPLVVVRHLIALHDWSRAHV